MGRGLLRAVKRITKRGQAELIDNLDAIETALTMGQALASAANVPFLPGVFDVVLELIALARKLRDGRERTVRLVQRVGRLMLELNDVLLSGASVTQIMRDPESPLARYVIKFSVLIQCMRTDMLALASDIRFYNQGRTIPQLARYEADLQEAQDAFNTKLLVYIAAGVSSGSSSAVPFSDGGDADAFGLRWPQVKVGPPTTLDRVTRMHTWWADTYTAEALGERLIIKQYTAGMRAQFEEHKKLLKSLRHPNFPQLFGHSLGDSAPFFLAIKTVSVVPIGEYLDFLCQKRPDSALCEAYNKLYDLVQAFRTLDNTSGGWEMRDLVIDENENVILGANIVASQRPWPVNDMNPDPASFVITWFMTLLISSKRRPLHALLRARSADVCRWGYIRDSQRLRSLLKDERNACPWPLCWPGDPNTIALSVGDIGHTVIQHGRAQFRRLCSALDFDDMRDEVSCQTIRTDHWLDVSGSLRPPFRPCGPVWIWDTDVIPHMMVYLGPDSGQDSWIHTKDIGYRFLHRHARQIGRVHGVVLILAVRRQLTHVVATKVCHFKYHFAHWATNTGTPTHLYGRPMNEPYTEAQISGGYDMDECSLSVQPDQSWASFFVQLEPEELEGDSPIVEL